ncbi:MAG: glycoside hydrolase family 127 protein [Halobacteriales archaeon]
MPDALAPVAFTDVTVSDPFWSPRLETLREVTMEEVYGHLDATGRIDNFRIAAGEQEGSFNGRFYNDSDVYKWLEAACYLLALEDDPTLEERVGEVVDAIAAAQAEDGYLNTYFQLEEPEKRWTNLHQMHELYCAGHLFEAAVAHHRATGRDRLLDVATSFADHIDRTFPEEVDGPPGHEEIELALVKLAHATGEERYLDLAEYFIDARGGDRFQWEIEHADEIAGGQNDHLEGEDGYDGTYLQDHAPVREQDTVEGHAVRATYLYAGMADVAMETGEPALLAALERLWENMTERRMYVTGGIGSSHVGERFTEDYDLPNETAYAETCAALGSILWNHRMLRLHGEGRFGDVLERTLYNGLLAGMSMAGDRFFYANPLEVNGEQHALHDEHERRFNVERQGWFRTACCPTNVPRLLAALGGYCYLRGEDALYVTLYVGSEAETAVGDTDVTLRQETDYPWEGSVSLSVDPEAAAAFDLALRVPGWATGAEVSVNGEAVEAPVEDGFARIRRTWTPGDEVTLDLGLSAERVAAHPAVRADAGRVALRRGPLVYCLEGTDHDRPLHQLSLPADAALDAEHDPDLLGGVTTLSGEVTVPDLAGWEDDLYRPADMTGTVATPLTAVPYYAWGHRDPGELRVWLRADGENG